MMDFNFESLYGAVVNFGSDPYKIEDEDAAFNLLQSIERASSFRVITDFDEFCVAKSQLDLHNCHVKAIYSFVDGSEFLVCLRADYFLPLSI